MYEMQTAKDDAAALWTVIQAAEEAKVNRTSNTSNNRILEQ